MAMRSKKIQPNKAEAINDLRGKIAKAQDFIFADYRGMTVEQISTLRRQLRDKNAEFHVVKNNFARILFEEMNVAEAREIFAGPTAVAFSAGEANEVAKAIVEFSKENPVKVKGAYVEKSYMDAKAVDAFSKLPGKNQLISMFMSAMISPVQKMAYLLVALKEKLEAQGGAPAAEAPAAEAPAAEAPSA